MEKERQESKPKFTQKKSKEEKLSDSDNLEIPDTYAEPTKERLEKEKKYILKIE